MKPKRNGMGATLIDSLYSVSHIKDKGILFLRDSKSEDFVSYCSLYTKARDTCSYFYKIGIKKNDELVLYFSDQESFIVTFWACILGGIIPVPLSARGEDEYISKFYKIWLTLNNPFLICEDTLFDKVRNYFAKRSVSNFLEIESKRVDLNEFSKYEGEIGNINILPNDIAYIQYSSGSTGHPKGIILTHQNLSYNTHDIITHSNINTRDSMLSWMPLTHDMGLIGVHLTGLVAGINQILIPTSLFIKRPSLWFDLTTRHRSTLLYSPNFGLNYLMSFLSSGQKYQWDLSCVRMIYIGAELISQSILKKFLEQFRIYRLRNDCLFPCYGLAEASVAVSIRKASDNLTCHSLDKSRLNLGDKIRIIADTSPHSTKVLEVGSPISNCKVRICDEDNNPFEAQVVGEIQIKGYNVTQGYYNNQSLTEDTFSPDGWLKTGDVGFLFENKIVVVGRKKNIIIINGQNYYPSDIENLICSNIREFAIGKVVALGYKNELTGSEEIIIFLQHRGATKKFAKYVKLVKDIVYESLALNVKDVVPIKKVPKTTSGKIQNFKLLENYKNAYYEDILKELQFSSIQGENSGLRNIEKHILQLLNQFTESKDINVAHNLLSIGLDSIKTTRLFNRIQEKYKTDLFLSDLFRFPTILELAQHIHTGIKSNQFNITSIEEQEHYPVTYAQNKFFLLHNYVDQQYAFNLSNACFIDGDLNVSALEMSFFKLIEEYEILRTTFRQVGETVRQSVLPNVSFSFQIEKTDLRNTPEPESIARERAKLIVKKSFDLENNLPIKVYIFQVSDFRNLLLVVVHHIVFDGWSAGVMIKRIQRLYRHYHLNEDYPDQNPRLQYKDYAVWQVQNVSSEVSKKHKELWLQEFNDEFEALNLSISNRKKSGLTFNGDHVDLVFTAELTKLIDEFCEANEITVFIVLTAAIQVLLHKYSGQTDIIIEINTAGRDNRLVEDQLGYFVNTLPIRQTVSPGDKFLTFLKKVRDKIVAAYGHQFYPFDLLIEDLKSKFHDSVGSSFNTLLLFQNFDHSFNFGEISKDLTVSSYDVRTDTSIIDLQFEFLKRDENLVLDINFNTDIFDVKQIEKLKTHFQYLLEVILVDPNKLISEYSMLTGQEEWLLSRFNNSNIVSYSALPSFIEQFEKMALEFADKVAVFDESSTLTYNELHYRSSQLANYLIQKYNIRRDDKGGILISRSNNMIIGILALLKTGATIVMLDADLPEIRINFMIEDSNTGLLLTDNITSLSQTIRVIEICDMTNEEIYTYNSTSPGIYVKGNLPAYIIYTSGSTGWPKGVIISHDALTDYIQTFKNYFELTSNDRIVQQSSLSFDLCIEEIFPALTVGAQLLIVKGGGKDIQGLQKVIQSQRATILSTTPLIISSLNKNPEKLTSLRTLISGGEALRPEHFDNLTFNLNLFNTYGPTEATVCVTYNKIEQPSETNILGYPLPNHEIYVLDEQQKPVPIGFPGEICISGSGLADGYINLVEETHNSFVKNNEARGSRFYRTGDIGKWTEDGKIEFIGRKNFHIKINGYRIDPREIEAQIILHLKTQHVVVRVVERYDEKSLAAYIESNQLINIRNIRKSLATVLPHYMIPAYFVQVERFNKNPGGKIDLSALPDPFQNGGTHNENSIPINPKEKKLLSIWNEVFETRNLGVTTNFFDMGGNSILAMQLISKIAIELKVRIHIRDIFENPSVRDLGSFLSGQNKEASNHIVPIEEQEFYEASNIQKRLWVLSQFEESQKAYNLSWAYKFEGHLDVEILSRSFRALIKRHQILSTRFRTVNGTLKQFLNKFDQDNFKIECIDIKQNKYACNVVRSIANQNAQQVFDLNTDLLLRVKLLRLKDHTCILLFAIHHTIADGWSINILIKELSILYNAFINGKESPLPLLNIQYKDCIHWLKYKLEGEKNEINKKYWKDKFSGEIPVLTLPLDFTRPLKQSYKGNSVSFYINRQIRSNLIEISRDNEASLFMILLTAINILIFKYTRQDDIIIGTPIADRRHEDLEGQIGCYLNTLAIRTIFDASNETFIGLLAKVRRSVIDAYEHQDYPFESLISDLTLERDTSRSPLFDILIGYQNVQTAHRYLKKFNGLKVSEYPIDEITSQFDLAVEFFEEDDRILVKLEYNTDLFLEESILKLSNHYVEILKVVTKSVNVKILDIEILTPPEIEEILYKFNTNTIDNDLCKIRTFKTVFEEQVNIAPESVALIYKDITLTYRCLNERANQLAHYLIHHFLIVPDEVIGILIERSEKSVITLLAIIKTGAAYLPIDTTYPKNRINHLIDDSKLKILLTDQNNLVSTFSNDLTLINVDSIEEELVSYSRSNPNVNVEPENLAYMIYTSGSTGIAKGVGVEHRNLLGISESWKHAYKLTTFPVSLLQVASFSFDVSCGDLCRALLNTGKIVICEDYSRFDIELLYHTLLIHKINIFESTPALVFPLTNYIISKGLMPTSLKLLIIGSDKLLVEDYKKLLNYFGSNIRILNSYGTTETTIDSSFYEQVTNLLPETGNVPIGRPLRNVKYYIFDEQMHLLPVGVAGELYIGGTGVARGYINQPELTDQKFIENPFRPEEKLYSTGDIARWRPDGNVEFLGRNDHQVKVRGYRIELGEIENLILQHPQMEQTVVICRENMLGENEIICYYVSTSGSSVLNIREFLSNHLPKFMLPSHFVHLAAIPLSGNGKIELKKLPCPDLDSNENEIYEAPRNGIEHKLTNIWCEILNKSIIGINDNFFELGGHSLKATQVMFRIHETLGMKLDLSEIFLYPTIKDLARIIQSVKSQEYEKIHSIEEQEYYEPSHGQKQLWISNQFEEEQLAYNMPIAYTFKGYLNKEALARSFMMLIRRHEILRTAFLVINGELKQKVLKPEPFNISYTDIRSSSKKDEKIKALIAEDLQSVFELSEGRLMRAQLVCIENKEHLFLFNIHHIICDGWSAEVLIEEIVKYYAICSRGVSIAPLKIQFQYKDYTAWQQKQIDQGKYVHQANYWLNRFRDQTPPLQLPTDFVRPPVKSHNGGSLDTIFSSALSKGLTNFSKKQSTSLFMVLLSSIQVLLYRYTEQEDIVIGVPVSGRGHKLLEKQVGFYVNTLPIKINIKNEDSFEKLLKNVRGCTLNAYYNQDYPFDLLVENLNLEREIGRSPLFDIMVVMEETLTQQKSEFKIDDLLVQEYPIKLNKCKFDIVFNFKKSDDQIFLNTQYRVDLFKKESIKRFTSKLLKILSIAIKEPFTRIDTFRLDGEKLKTSSNLELDQSFNFEF